MDKSNEIKVFLPDGSQRAMPLGATCGDVAKSIGPGLAKSAVAAKCNGKMCDLSQTLQDGDKIEIVTGSSPLGLEVIRHSTAHLMAMAIQKLYPGTQITIGPVVENQFYYDILPPEGLKISSLQFPDIEKAMAEIAAQDLPVTRHVVSRDQAIAHFKNLGELFKVELIQDIPSQEDVSLYEMGGWSDLCRGPHVPSTGKLAAFKLMSISGAFWRAKKENPQLVRIYGTAWSTKKELDAYLNMLEEARKRDHVVLGKQLELFQMHPELAVGAPFYLPHGAKLFSLLTAYMRKMCGKYGYQEVITPQLMNVSLWKTSGHYDHYRENMYFSEIDDQDYALKPMNCPGHVQIYTSKLRSYRELPLRISEFGVVHRHELSGAVHGLTRVRRFTQDDAHIFCMPSQVLEEIKSCLRLTKEVYHHMGFQDVVNYLSTRPEKRVGDEALWDLAEKSLEEALQSESMTYSLNPGDGAFYGPKIDICVKDAIGRWHQCATIQLDFQMPQRFGASFISGDNKAEVPVMIHRAVLGSLDRFMGIFIEHWAGHFPLGLSPVQVRVVTVSEQVEGYGQQVVQALQDHGVRVEADLGNDKLSAKIRNAQLRKIPYMLVIGEKEMETQVVTPRYWDGKNLPPLSVPDFINKVRQDSGVFWGLDANQN